MRNPFGLQKPQETKLTKLVKSFPPESLSFDVEKMCGDPDFADKFVDSVPDETLQREFLINSSLYDSHKPGYKPEFVLLFRRTLPSETPKPENRWTNEFVQVKNGLRVEIPDGPHRLHSVILCDTLKKLVPDDDSVSQETAFTDGEIIVNQPAYNQKESLLVFKPSAEKEKLEEYLKTEGALTLEQVTEKVKELKGETEIPRNPGRL